MADERLQQLRRAWDEGDLETQVRLLRERMRAGELSEEQVRLAAYLGDQATLVLGLDGEATPPEDTFAWLEGFADWEEASARSQLAISRELAHRWHSATQESTFAEVIHGLEVQLSCPCESHEAGLKTAVLDCVANLDSDLIAPIPKRHAHATIQAVLGMACVCADVAETIRLPTHFSQKTRHPSVGSIRLSEFLEACLKVVRADDLRDAIRDELVPWALGLRDPLAERVAARGAGGSV